MSGIESGPPRSLKDRFIKSLESELSKMVDAGTITEERLKDKLEAARLIEVGFSNNPEHDAKIFSRAGVVGEEELIEVLKEGK